MNKRKAEAFEEALQQADRGQPVEERFAPLVELVGRLAWLSQPPPPPPNQLRTGRQRFLALASRLRTQEIKPQIPAWKGRTEMRGVMKLATALIVVILISGMALAAAPVMADSLPGDPLYGPRLALEQVRLALTRSPQARAEVGLAMAERRLQEVIALIEQNRGVDEPTMNRVEQHLMHALRLAAQVQDPAASRALQRLALAIQERERTMTRLMDRTQQSGREQLRQVLRIMERVRTEAQLGQEDPNGLRQRLRQGVPPIPTPEPTPGPWHTPGPQMPTEPARRHGPPTQVPSGQGGPPSTEPPGPGPQPTQPAGPNPTEPPGPGPQPTQPAGPNPTEPPGPGPQPTQPAGPNPTEPPGPGPQPTQPAGPNPTEPPGPGPQPTQPAGPNPTEPPGPGPQPTQPAGPNPTEPPSPSATPGSGGGNYPGGSQPGPGSGGGMDNG